MRSVATDREEFHILWNAVEDFRRLFASDPLFLRRNNQCQLEQQLIEEGRGFGLHAEPTLGDLPGDKLMHAIILTQMLDLHSSCVVHSNDAGLFEAAYIVAARFPDVRLIERVDRVAVRLRRRSAESFGVSLSDEEVRA